MNILSSNRWILRQEALSDWNTFIEFWQRFYNYSSTNPAYEELIINRLRPFSDYTANQVRQLYLWKNNTKDKLNINKTSSVERMVQKLDIINQLVHEWNEVLFKVHFGKISTVWQVFLMHIISPDRFPIFDQHVYRAYSYLTNQGSLALSGNVQNQLLLYKQYQLFFDQIQQDCSSISPRTIDQALWAFGRFIKQLPAGLML